MGNTHILTAIAILRQQPTGRLPLFAFSRKLCKWNHAVYNPFLKYSVTQHTYFAIHVVACVSTVFLVIAEQC